MVGRFLALNLFFQLFQFRLFLGEGLGWLAALSSRCLLCLRMSISRGGAYVLGSISLSWPGIGSEAAGGVNAYRCLLLCYQIFLALILLRRWSSYLIRVSCGAHILSRPTLLNHG